MFPTKPAPAQPATSRSNRTFSEASEDYDSSPVVQQKKAVLPPKQTRAPTPPSEEEEEIDLFGTSAEDPYDLFGSAVTRKSTARKSTISDMSDLFGPSPGAKPSTAGGTKPKTNFDDLFGEEDEENDGLFDEVCIYISFVVVAIGLDNFSVLGQVV